MPISQPRIATRSLFFASGRFFFVNISSHPIISCHSPLHTKVTKLIPLSILPPDLQLILDVWKYERNQILSNFCTTSKISVTTTYDLK